MEARAHESFVKKLKTSSGIVSEAFMQCSFVSFVTFLNSFTSLQYPSSVRKPKLGCSMSD